MQHPAFRSIIASAALFAAGSAAAQPGIVTSIATGYDVATIPLPADALFGGAIGNVEGSSDEIVIFYSQPSADVFARVNIQTGVVTPLLSDSTSTQFVFPGGAAVLADGSLVWTDNGTGKEDVFVAIDANASNDFDASEVHSMASRGLLVADPTGQANFTGSKLRVIPANGLVNGLNAGDIVAQTADDDFGTGALEPSEVIAIRGAATLTPSWVPAPAGTNQAFFRPSAGDDLVFDAGFGIGPAGSLIAATLLGDFTTLRLLAAKDADTNGQVGAAEYHELGEINVGGGYDMSSNTAGRLVIVAGGNVLTTEIDGDPMTATVAGATDLVTTSSFFLGGGILTSATLPFEPGGDPGTSAAFVFADFAGTELYVVRPTTASSVPGWMLY